MLIRDFKWFNFQEFREWEAKSLNSFIETQLCYTGPVNLMFSQTCQNNHCLSLQLLNQPWKQSQHSKPDSNIVMEAHCYIGVKIVEMEIGWTRA